MRWSLRARAGARSDAAGVGRGQARRCRAPPQTSSIEDIIKKHEQELEQARNRQRDAVEAENKLKAEIAAIGQDRNKLNRQLIDVAARVRSVEGRIVDTETRLRTLDERETTIRNSLEARRAETTEVLAALQRAGRRAPPALMVRPEDALQSLRTAMLLGAVVPEMRARAERLIGDLGNLVSIRKETAEQKERLLADRDSLTTDQRRLAALIDERQRKQSDAEKDMEAERRRAAELSKQADNLRDLIAKMEQDLKTAAKAAAAAAAAAKIARRRNAESEKYRRAEGPGTTEPGHRLCLGQRTAADAGERPQTSQFWQFRRHRRRGKRHFGGSASGRAGHNSVRWLGCVFRTVSKLRTTLDHQCRGRVSCPACRDGANFGQHRPVRADGRTGGDDGDEASQVASILAAAPSQPVLYIEFRKDNAPIDPGPWWAASEGEKVRG